MSTRSSRIMQWQENIFRAIAAFSRCITRPSVKVEPKQRRRFRLLSGFLLLMTLNTLAGSISLKNIDGNLWLIMAVASATFLFSYFVSRSRYYRAALVLALVIPAVRPLAIAILKPPEINLTAELMWLSLPLLISGLMLTVRQTIILTSSYIALIIILELFGYLGVEILAPLMAYILIVTLIVTAISAVRRADQSEIENHLAERLQAEKSLRESEEKFSKVFRLSPQEICITRVKDGKTVEINESFTRFSGYTREDILGETSTRLDIWTKPGDRQKMLKILAENGRVRNEEFEFRIKSGEVRTQLFSAEPISFNGEECIISILTDITERKQMEKSLQESEEKFSKAFHASPEAISISTLSDGTFLEVNRAFSRITGYSQGELVFQNADKLDMWAIPEQRERMLKKIRNRVRIRNEEYDFLTKSGDIRTMLLSTDYIRIGGHPCLLVVSADITERRQIEKNLQESEEKFSKAFNAGPQMIVITRARDNVTLEVNDSFTHATGFTREETIGRTASELGVWISSEDNERLMQMLKEKGHVHNEEFNYHDKSGGINTHLISVEPINIGGEDCWISILLDITKRKRMEQALRDSEEKFSSAFHAIPESISISTLKEGIFLDVNDSFLLRNGHTREEVIGHKAEDINLWANIDGRDRMQRLMQDSGGFENEEFEFRTTSGETRTVLLSADTINLHGEPCLLVVGNDITERKQAENILKEAMTSLEHSTTQLKSTNQELESFSYSVSHDLRSPLRSIDGFSQALLEDYSAKLDEKGQDYLNRLRVASQKMGELIDGLLKLSRLTRSEMHPEKVDLSALAEEISTRLQETHPNSRAKFVIDSGLSANGDPQLLRVLLENLLGNAWKFTSKTPRARIEFGSTANGAGNTFFIKDNGAGFDMAYKDKLFGAFQRLHDITDFPGTGIGLATVQRIINRHGGNIHAEGAVGKGAAFYFTLS